MVDDAFEALVDAIRATGSHVGGGVDRAEGYAYATELVRIALDLFAVVRNRPAVFDSIGRFARMLYSFVVEAAARVSANLAQLAEALQAGLEAHGPARNVVPSHGVFEKP